jgi:hypothetical protein
MRQVSQSAAAAMTSESSQLVPITLLKIEHPDETTLFFCNNNENVFHLTQEYQFYPFKVRFPQSTGSDEKVQSRITIGNIDQDIIALLRSLKSAPTITIKVIYVDGNDDLPTSDDIEYGPIELEYTKHDVTPETITGTIALDEKFLYRQFPSRTFNPETAAGVFE